MVRTENKQIKENIDLEKNQLIFFKGEFLMRKSNLKANQLYWPIFSHRKNKINKKTQIVIIGSMYYWDKFVNIEPFYKKYNKLLDIIRFYHKEYDLIYLNHPSSDEEQNLKLIG